MAGRPLVSRIFPEPFQLPGLDVFNKSRNVYGYRATGDTARLTAVQTSSGFSPGQLKGIAKVNFSEILYPDPGILLWHRLTVNGHPFSGRLAPGAGFFSSVCLSQA